MLVFRSRALLTELLKGESFDSEERYGCVPEPQAYRNDPVDLVLRYVAAIKRDFYRALEHYPKLKQPGGEPLKAVQVLECKRRQEPLLPSDRVCWRALKDR